MARKVSRSQSPTNMTPLLGRFEITSGEVMISDPTYLTGDFSRWSQDIEYGVKNGVWKAGIYRKEFDGWGVRTSALIVYHEEESVEALATSGWHLMFHNLGVDSGLAGIYDREYFGNNNVIPSVFNATKEDERWHEFHCYVSKASAYGAGVIGSGLPGTNILGCGAFSSTGIGDGCYEVYGKFTEAGEIIGLAIVYLDDDIKDIVNAFSGVEIERATPFLCRLSPEAQEARADERIRKALAKKIAQIREAGTKEILSWSRSLQISYLKSYCSDDEIIDMVALPPAEARRRLSM